MSGTKRKEIDNKLDCDCFVESHIKPTCPPIRNVSHPLRYYEFTQEEMKALEECDRESFYRRCLPFSAVLASLTYAAIKNDVIRPHQHFGVVPKVVAAMCVGYVVGRVSYQGHYDQHLRDELPPDSYLGKVLRKYHDDAAAAATKPAKSG